MVRHRSAEGLIFSSACRFASDKVRIGAAETGRTDHLMAVKHHLMLGCLLEGEHIMVDERLAVVMLSYRKDISYITALDRIISVFVHKLESLVDMSFVVTDR